MLYEIACCQNVIKTPIAFQLKSSNENNKISKKWRAQSPFKSYDLQRNSCQAVRPRRMDMLCYTGRFCVLRISLNLSERPKPSWNKR